MRKTLALLLAFIGMAVDVGGAASFFALQTSVQGTSIWPLPGFILLDWAVLGMVGFGATYSNFKAYSSAGIKTVWFITGALATLVVLGAFSFGLLALVSISFILAAAILITLPQTLRWFEILGWILLGAASNLGIWFLLFLVSNR